MSGCRAGTGQAQESAGEFVWATVASSFADVAQHLLPGAFWRRGCHIALIAATSALQVVVKMVAAKTTTTREGAKREARGSGGVGTEL